MPFSIGQVSWDTDYLVRQESSNLCVFDLDNDIRDTACNGLPQKLIPCVSHVSRISLSILSTRPQVIRIQIFDFASTSQASATINIQCLHSFPEPAPEKVIADGKYHLRSHHTSGSAYDGSVQLICSTAWPNDACVKLMRSRSRRGCFLLAIDSKK